ncbi:YraN family protein [Candidatus Peregrinibacteria bacterium]|nr:YraN family protein [Candidatus Peregrinibacteria bacterium]
MDKKSLQKAKNTGRLGEEYAAGHLVASGYTILGTNFHSRFGEIDIIAKYEDEVIFCEVKTRRNLAYGLPQEAFNHKKYSRIKKTIYEFFRTASKNADVKITKWRIDLIAILINSFDEVEDLVHYKGV